MIDLPALASVPDGLWETLLELAHRHPDKWTLVGGQMVLLHGLEHGRQPFRLSTDLDVIVDVRARPDVLAPLVASLHDLGFELVDIGIEEIGQRFARGAVSIDVLVPDGIGARNPPVIIGRIAAVAVSGGTFALANTEHVQAQFGGRTERLPRPDLAGALVIKSEAAHRDRQRGPARHLIDLAFLYSLVDDPPRMAERLSLKNRRRLGRIDALADTNHPAWRALGPLLSTDAHDAFVTIARLEQR